MNDFPLFVSSILSAFSDFLWFPGTRYLTGCLVFLCLIGLTKRLINL